MDYLHPLLDDAAIARMSSLALAHVGDAVYEILVRTHLACGGTQTAKNLHSQTIALVRASAQAKAIEHILPDLTEEEQTVYRHGRNAKPKTVPKSASVAEYAHATALEALFGWLYLNQRYDRINELFGKITELFYIFQRRKKIPPECSPEGFLFVTGRIRARAPLPCGASARWRRRGSAGGTAPA